MLLFPETCGDVSIFGSKTHPTLAGQPAAFQREGPGASALLRNARHGLERLLDPALVRVWVDRLYALSRPQARAGRDAMAA
jgi:hypothetical protein